MKKKATREKPAPPSDPAWRRHALPILALWGVALAAYSNSFHCGLIFDNFWLIVKDSRLRAATSQNIDLILTQEYWYNSSLTGLYRPLTTLSYLFNYAILGSGDQPASYHWVNFTLHAVNIALVYLLGLALLEGIAPALAMAGLWALHPVITESVTNVVGRADILSAFGVLAGLLCHIRGAQALGRRKLAWLCALSLAAAIGVFAKESAVAVLAAVLIYDFTFRSAVSWRSLAPGYVALAPPFAIFFYLRGLVLSKLPAVHPAFVENPLGGVDFWTARFTALKVAGKYLWLLVWPAHLSNDYSYNQVPLFTWGFKTWEDWKAVLALAVCVAAVAIAAACYRRNRPVFFCIAFFFAALAPTSNLILVIGTIMAERFLYLPSVGFAGCMVVAIYAACRRIPATWAAPAALALLGVAFAARTYVRNFDWLDARALWTSAVKDAPHSFKSHMNLAAIMTRPNAPLDTALSETDRFLAILDGLPDERNFPSAYTKAGLLYCRQGDLVSSSSASSRWYKKALDMLLRAKRIALAVALDSTEVDVALAIVYERLGNPGAAEQALQLSSKRWPQVEYFEAMSDGYCLIGDLRQGAVTLIEGLILNASNTRLASVALELYKLIDPGGCAVRNTGLNMQCPLVHQDVCTASRNVFRQLVKRNRINDANQAMRSAVQDLGCPAEEYSNAR